MSDKRRVLKKEAFTVGNRLGISWLKIDLEQFRKGLEVEIEREGRDSGNNVTDNNLLSIGKIVLAHLKESSDYYKRLDVPEEENKL